jgi:hypothetical protein
MVWRNGCSRGLEVWQVDGALLLKQQTTLIVMNKCVIGVASFTCIYLLYVAVSVAVHL